MKRIIYFSALVLLLVGCRQKSSEPVGDAVLIEIPETKTGPIEDIVENFRYVTLKHGENSDAMLGTISKLRVFRDRIYVLDNSFTNKMLIFDKKGNFLKKVGRAGKGPMEYTDITTFEVDIFHEELLIKDSSRGKILIFDLDGNYKRSLDCRIWGGGMTVLPNGNRVYGIEGAHTNEPEFGGKYKLILCDGENNIFEKYCENKGDYRIGEMGMTFLNPGYDGTITFAPQYMGDVYRISESGVERIYRINFPDMANPEELVQYATTPENYGSFLSQKTVFAGNHADSEDYLCVRYEHKGRDHTAYYHKKSGTTVVTTDVVYGRHLTFDEEGTLWGAVMDITLEIYGKGEKALEIREAIAASGNPVVVCYTLKKELEI